MASFEIKHKFVSPKPDGSETDLLRPSDWNAEHDFELTGSGAVARLGAGTGPAEFVPFGTGANEIPLNSHLGNAAYATLGNAIGNAVQVVDVGEGVAGLPALDARNLTNLPLPEDGPLPQASTSQQGIVQLTNSFTGTEETLAVTPKALSDGIASVDDWPGMYTGSSSSNTNYPIGTTLVAFTNSGIYVPNAAVPATVGTTTQAGYSGAGNTIMTFASGASLSGTWRSRGYWPATDGGSPHSSLVDYWYCLIQRVA